MTGDAAERFDADPEAYEEYLRTPLGRLRTELAWRNLAAHLPRPTDAPRALDLGAGTGELALRLAAAGWSVTLVDGSPRMLEVAAELARGRGLGGKITCRLLDLDAGHLAEAVEASAYHLVICHDVLEYVASPEALLEGARAALAAGGRASIVARGATGEAWKRLLRGAEPAAALGLLTGRRLREDLFGLDVRLFGARELTGLAGAAGLEVVAEYGVRVAADHLTDWQAGGEDAFARMVELEARLGALAEFRSLARYIQVIAAPGSAALLSAGTPRPSRNVRTVRTEPTDGGTGTLAHRASRMTQETPHVRG